MAAAEGCLFFLQVFIRLYVKWQQLGAFYSFSRYLLDSTPDGSSWGLSILSPGIYWTLREMAAAGGFLFYLQVFIGLYARWQQMGAFYPFSGI